MSKIPSDLRSSIERIAADRDSGASELLAASLELLGRALRVPGAVDNVARELCAAQPTMAPMWNAALEALAAASAPERFERFVQRVSRAQAEMVKLAATHLATRRAIGPLVLTTLSHSG